MTDPRIGAFARLASGNVEPVRTIYGNISKLTRVAHGITYDAGRDEIIGSEPLAAAVVAFRGGVGGQVPPLRVLQGNKTMLHAPQGVVVDDLHHELIVGDNITGYILTYPWDANGNVAPLRVIAGPRTGMAGVMDIGVDPQRGLIVAVARHQREGWGVQPGGGIFIFKRTANGNVAPLRVITGPHTGMRRGPLQVGVWGGKVFATVSNDDYQPPYDRGGFAPKPGCTGPPLPPLTMGSADAFVGVWNITDSGDQPPRFTIHGPATHLVAPAGIALNPRSGEVYVTDGGVGAAFTFLIPQAF